MRNAVKSTFVGRQIVWRFAKSPGENYKQLPSGHLAVIWQLYVATQDNTERHGTRQNIKLALRQTLIL